METQDREPLYHKVPRTLIALSEQLEAMPQPKHKVGEVVIAPDDKGKPIYAVVQFSCADLEKKGEWLYAVTIESDLTASIYFPEYLLIHIDLIRA